MAELDAAGEGSGLARCNDLVEIYQGIYAEDPAVQSTRCNNGVCWKGETNKIK